MMTNKEFVDLERAYKKLWNRYQLIQDKESHRAKSIALRLNKMWKKLHG